MKHLLIRRGVNLYLDIVNKLKSKIAPSSCMYLTDGNLSSLEDKIKYKPMFSQYYILEFEYKQSTDSDKLLSKIIRDYEHVMLIVYTDSFTDFTNLCNLYYDVFTFVDTCNVSKDILRKYIVKTLLRLGVGRDMLTVNKINLILSRLKYQEYLLDNKLLILSSTDLSEKTIKNVIPKYKGVTVSNFCRKLLLGKNKRQINDMLLRYMNNPDYLFNPTYDYVQSLLKLYSLYIEGDLSPNNKSDWIVSYGEDYNILSMYQLDTILKIFNQTSYELMFVYSSILRDNLKSNNLKKILSLHIISESVVPVD